MRNSSIVDALNRLRPNAQWTFAGDFTYACLEWKDEVFQKPSEAEILAAMAAVDAEYERNEYQRKRVLEYPPIEYYIDGVVKGDQDQIQAYIDTCLMVKRKYPKP
jgi:hypothetical protein